MEFQRMSAEERDTFEADGFLVVRNALDQATVERMLKSCDRLAGPFLRKYDVPDKHEYNLLDWRPGLISDEVLRSLVTSCPAVPYVVQLLGPNIHLHSTSLSCKRPSSPDSVPFRRGWHRDMRLPKDIGHATLPRVGIKICFCLTDFDSPDHGMTKFVRGSHLRTEPLVIPRGQVDPGDVEVCDLRVRAGDAVLFENRTYHTASPNLSDRVSKVLFYGYAYRWMNPEVYLQNPNLRELDKLDPVLRQLLGGYPDIDTAPWALQRWAERHGVHWPPVVWSVEQ